MTIWPIRIAYWIIQAADPHSECVILTVFPLQQWLQERTSMLRYSTLLVLLVLLFCLIFVKNSLFKSIFCVIRFFGYTISSSHRQHVCNS